MASQIRKNDSVATQVSKVASKPAFQGQAQAPAGYRAAAGNQGAGADNRGSSAALEILYLALRSVYRVFGARRIQVGPGLNVNTLEDGETVILESGPFADPVTASRMR